MRYFILVRDAQGVILKDDEGSEFSTLEEAIEDARLTVGQLTEQWVRFDQPVPYINFQVTDGDGTVCADLAINDVIRLH